MKLESVKGAAVAVAMESAGAPGTSGREPVRTEAGMGGESAAVAKVPSHPVVPMAKNTQDQHEGKQNQEEDAGRQLKNAIQQANSKIKHSGRRNCEFTYHEESNRISIKVYDAETKEVIREIPPEETLVMVEKMYELAGILVDERR